MRSFLSLFTKLYFHTAPVARALRTSARIERISERVLVFQAREARFVPYKRAFSSVYVLLLHIERTRLLKTTTTTTPYVCAYTKRAQETLRDFEEAKKQSALKRARFLNCSLVVFVLFSSLSCVVVVVRISRSGVLRLLTYSISARSRGFYRANKNSILSVKKNTLHTHTHVCVCTARVREFWEHLVEL